MLGEALAQFEIPLSERRLAISHLDNMLIDARTLFRDLDAAAKTARMRLEATGGLA